MMERAIATGFGLGHLRPAPGTWASAATVALGYVLHRLGHFPLVAMATLLVIALGFWAVARATARRAALAREVEALETEWLELQEQLEAVA